MSRPPLPLGTWGKIRTYILAVDDKGKPRRSRAVAQYRDYDGVTRPVEAYAKTPAQAENALRARLKERAALSRKGELTALHRFSDASTIWMRKLRELVRESARSPGSVDVYERHLNTHVLPAIGEVRLGEITTPLLDKFIGRIKTDVGAPTAKTCRSVVSGVMGLAVRYGAISANPVRDVDRISVRPKREPRALTAEEWKAWLTKLQSNPRAVEQDLPELCLFLMGTGTRIGEALAVLWGQVDFETSEVEVSHTIIRVKGEGLLRKPTKSRAGERLLRLPPSAVAMLRSRFMVGVRLDDPVFPDTFGGFRDPANTRRQLRGARGDGLLAWVTSHSFRKTVATALDHSGHSGRQVADQLGHSRPSMTQDVYLGRKVVNPTAADALERFLSVDDPGTSPDQKHG